ncbi:MAG TPA: VTT domain-containing protein [Bacillales bacterium]
MLDFIMEILKHIGLWGLFLSLAIEASSVPFPGTLVALVYGYLLDPSIIELIWLSLVSALVYTAASFIPYGIGFKLEDRIKRKMNKKKFEKAQKWFAKFGQWSIAIGRPLGLGNYISYISGISKVKPLRFGILTFIGIFPWIFVMFFLGQAGNLKTISGFLSGLQQYLYMGIGAAIILYIIYRITKKKRNKPSNSGSKLSIRKLF